MGFRHRLALFLVVTLAAVQLLTAFVAYTYLRHSLVEKAEGEMTAATAVFVRQLGVLSERVADDVAVLSLDYALRTAIARSDHDTELSALRNHGRRVGATRMMLVGLDGAIVADTGKEVRSGAAFPYSDLLIDSDSSNERTALATLDGRIYWIVVAPIRAPIAIAYIAACIPVNDLLLEKLRGLSTVQRSIALATIGPRGNWQVVARTANGPADIRLPAIRGLPNNAASVGDDRRGEFLTVATSLTTAAHSAPVIVVLGYPLAEAFAAYRSIVIPVLLFLAFALLLAVVGAMIVVRGVSRPLEALAGVARRIAAGDYTPPQPIGQKDELGQLSDALIGMTRSIAEREAALTSAIDALEIARSEAVQANSAKSQFLANMSHELRTPLNAILGFGEMLHQEVLGPLGVKRYGEYAADICSSGQRLLDLVSRMFDLAEVEGGRLTLAGGKVSPGEILRQAFASMRATAEKAGVSTTLSGDIAAAPEITGDAVKLRQAFTGILHNAIKFSHAGGAVKASMTVGDGESLIRIEDNGVGMRAEDTDVVVRPFHRLRSAFDGRHQGAGLGLPFAKAIIELHGGTLRIESAPGQGTSVEIRLLAMAASLQAAA
jgi:signal transduction histidine kinase